MKKTSQQLSTQANPSQVQVGGGNAPIPPAKATPTLAVPPAVTPPPANVPRKAQVGRPAKVAKLKSPHRRWWQQAQRKPLSQNL